MTTTRFEFWGPCEKEFERLTRKFRTLPKDLERFQQIITLDATGSSQHRVVLHEDEDICIVKARLMCQALRKNSLRIIYAYHRDTVSIVWIELYHKADKENEDRERVRQYLKNPQ